MKYFRYNTSGYLLAGPFLDWADGITPETTLIITASGVKLGKDESALSTITGSFSANHVGDGFYRIPYTTSEVDTVGNLTFSIQISGAVPVWHEGVVLSQNVYDSKIIGTDLLDVNVTQIEGSDATDQIRDAIVDDATRLDATAINGLAGNDPGSQLASQSDITGLNNLSGSDVQTVLENNDLDHLIQVTAGAEEPTDGSYLDQIMHANGGQTFDATTDSLEAIRDNQSSAGPDAATIADAVWDEDIVAAHNTADTAGALLDTDISTRSGHSAADVWAVATRVLTANTNLNDPTAAEIRTEMDSNSTQLAQILTDVGNLNDLSTTDIFNYVVENSKTFVQYMRIMKSILAGITTNGGLNFRDDADSKNRAQVTVDANNNRTAVVLDGS